MQGQNGNNSNNGKYGANFGNRYQGHNGNNLKNLDFSADQGGKAGSKNGQGYYGNNNGMNGNKGIFFFLKKGKAAILKAFIRKVVVLGFLVQIRIVWEVPVRKELRWKT